ncbi:MAG: 30S ribosome-binding factor RbfA [Rhodothermales bacterium]
MSIRTERLSRLVQREVAELLNNEFFEASQSMVTVTNVRVTKDLGIAYINVSILGEEPARRQIAFRRLEDIAPQVRQALAQRIRHQVRRIPELKFFLDESQQMVARMEELFDQIREERSDRDDEQPEADAPGVDESASGEQERDA